MKRSHFIHIKNIGILASTNGDPNLHYQFHIAANIMLVLAKLHPQYETVRKVCEPWILNLARLGSGHLLDNLIPCCVPLFPEATNLQAVEIVTKFIAWLFLSNDIEDNGPLLLGTKDSCSTGSH